MDSVVKVLNFFFSFVSVPFRCNKVVLALATATKENERSANDLKNAFLFSFPL